MPRLPALLLVASILVAGCTGLAPPAERPSPTDGSPTATATPTATTTPTVDPTTGTPNYGPQPDHPIVVVNNLGNRVTLRVRVIREATNETVYDESVTLDPGERTVYNTAAAAPDGIEKFRIIAERGGERTSVTIETSECYGDAIVTVTDDGSLDATYSVC